MVLYIPDYIDLLYFYTIEGLYDSSLLLSETLLEHLLDSFSLNINSCDDNIKAIIQNFDESEVKIVSDLDIESCACCYAYFILNSLQNLRFYERIFNFIRSNLFLLKCDEIKNMFLLSISKLDEKVTNKFIFKDIDNVNEKGEGYYSIKEFIDSAIGEKYTEPLSSKSLSNLYQGMSRIEYCDSEYLSNAFIDDYRNLEALFTLKKYKLKPKIEILEMIKNFVPDINLKIIYCRILFYKPIKNYSKNNSTKKFINIIEDNYLIFSPWRGFRHSKILFIDDDKNELLNVGMFMFSNFPRDSLSLLSLSYYYIKLQQYKEAHRCISEAVKINFKNNGIEMLFFGYVYTLLKDPSSALSCYKLAKNKLRWTYKPALFLALEFKRMNDDEKARAYFISATECKPQNILVIYNYARFLYEMEELENFKETFERIKNIFKINYGVNVDDPLLGKKALKDIVNQKYMSKFGRSGENICNIYYIFIFFYHISRENYELAENTIKKMFSDVKRKACTGFLYFLRNDKLKAADYFLEVVSQNQETALPLEPFKSVPYDEDFFVFEDLLKACLDEKIRLGDKEISQLKIEIFLALTKDTVNLNKI